MEPRRRPRCRHATRSPADWCHNRDVPTTADELPATPRAVLFDSAALRAAAGPGRTASPWTRPSRSIPHRDRPVGPPGRHRRPGRRGLDLRRPDRRPHPQAVAGQPRSPHRASNVAASAFRMGTLRTVSTVGHRERQRVREHPGQVSACASNAGSTDSRNPSPTTGPPLRARSRPNSPTRRHRQDHRLRRRSPRRHRPPPLARRGRAPPPRRTPHPRICRRLDGRPLLHQRPHRPRVGKRFYRMNQE